MLHVKLDQVAEPARVIGEHILTNKLASMEFLATTCINILFTNKKDGVI